MPVSIKKLEILEKEAQEKASEAFLFLLSRLMLVHLCCEDVTACPENLTAWKRFSGWFWSEGRAQRSEILLRITDFEGFSVTSREKKIFSFFKKIWW